MFVLEKLFKSQENDGRIYIKYTCQDSWVSISQHGQYHRKPSVHCEDYRLFDTIDLYRRSSMWLGIWSYGISSHSNRFKFLPLKICFFNCLYLNWFLILIMLYVSNIEIKRELYDLTKVHIAAMPSEDSVCWSTHWLCAILSSWPRQIIRLNMLLLIYLFWD